MIPSRNLYLNVLAALVLALVAGVPFAAEKAEPAEADKAAAEARVFTCAMHPQVKTDAPGRCPICGMDLIPVVGAEPAPADADKAAEAAGAGADEPVRVADIRIAAPEIVERSETGIVGPDRPRDSLKDIVMTLGAAEADDGLGAVLVRLEHFGGGWAQAEDVRRAVASCAEAKKVYVYLGDAGKLDYLIASAGTAVYMHPQGELDLTNLRVEAIFLRGLLDWIGVEAELFTAGKYKGADEPFTRWEISPEQKTVLTSVLEDLTSTLADAVAAGRKTTRDQAKKLIDGGPYTAADALKAKLVDGLVYADGMSKIMVDDLGAPVDIERSYGRKETAVDLAGFMALFGGTEEIAPVRGRRLAVIFASGVISDRAAQGLFASEGIAADQMVSTLRKLGADDDVLAVVLRISSPGGTVTASDKIWRELMDLRKKKPLIVSMGDVAASGGYYIACPAHVIFAEPGTITGSIGVVGGKLNLKGLYNKLGINKALITGGDNATMTSDYAAYSDKEKAFVRRVIDEIYDDFVAKVAQGRGMKKEAVEKVAQGRIWTGGQAATNGLVDRIGGLADALDSAKAKAGLKPDEPVALDYYPKPRPIIEKLMEGFELRSGGAPMSLALLREIEPALAARVAALRKLRTRRVIAVPELLVTVK